MGIETGFPSIPTIRKAREEMGGGGALIREGHLSEEISLFQKINGTCQTE